MKSITALLLTIFALSITISAQQTTARKTVTNADLEKYRAERLKNDPDDERERKRLGLPSRVEQEQQRQQRAQEISELSARLRAREAQKQNFYQSQAAVLGAEIASVQAEINYVRARLNEIPAPQQYYAVGYLPYSYNNFGGVGIPRGYNKVESYGGVRANVTWGGNNRVTLGANAGSSVIRQNGNWSVTANNIQAPRTNLTFGGIPYQPGILTVPFTIPNAQNLTREELLSRLRILEQNRAGLLARWNILEDEAHRAGVRID